MYFLINIFIVIYPYLRPQSSVTVFGVFHQNPYNTCKRNNTLKDRKPCLTRSMIPWKDLPQSNEHLYLTLISLQPRKSKHRDLTISLFNLLKSRNISPHLEGSREDNGTYLISLRLNLNNIKSVLLLLALIELEENSFTIRTYTPKFSKIIIRGLTYQILEDDDGIDELTSKFDESTPLVKARPDHHAEIGGKTNTLVLLYHITLELLKENPRITIQVQCRDHKGT